MPVHTKRAPIKTDQKDALWLAQKLQPIRDALRMGDYDILGNLSFVNIQTQSGEVKTIDFRKSGPAVARARSMSQMLIVSPWDGIPPHVATSDDFCTACLAECDACQGKGKKLCEAPFCGGDGIQHKPSGDVTCIACAGTGQATCSACRGRGKKATGILGGSYDFEKGLCPQCKGRKFQSREISMDPRDFSCGNFGGMLALGPLIRFSVRPLPTSAKPAAPLIFDVMEDVFHDPMVILVDEKEGQAFLVGGIARQASR